MDITVGTRVRSFDFESRDLEGERACYVEGVVVGIVDEGMDCPRYNIRVERKVFGGKECEVPEGHHVYPPVNGTRTTFGRTTNGVEVAHEGEPCPVCDEYHDHDEHYLDAETVELHISPDPGFVKKYGKRLKAAGGSYRHARGYASSRIVFVPFTHPDLADAILRDFPGSKKTTVIFRGPCDQGPGSSNVRYWYRDNPQSVRDIYDTFVTERRASQHFRSFVESRYEQAVALNEQNRIQQAREEACAKLLKSEAAAAVRDLINDMAARLKDEGFADKDVQVTVRNFFNRCQETVRPSQ